MSQLGVKCPRGFISWSECLGVCAHDPLRPCDYTADLLNMMRQGDDADQPRDDAFTPTRLLGCARQRVLVGEHDYYVDVDQAYPATRGNMVHALMEAAQYPGALHVIREERFKVEIETPYGVQDFSAKPDLIVVKSIETDPDPEGDEQAILKVKIVDYKSIVKVDNSLDEPKLEHQLQVNMYAWLVEKTLAEFLGMPNLAVEVDELEILYCSMDGKRRFTSAGPRTVPARRKINGRMVDSTLELQPITRWSMDKIGRYVQAKITERLEAQHVRLPDILEGDQAWLCRYCPVYDVCHEIGNIPEEDNV